MGCSTRLDVRLRTYVPARAGKAPVQDLTDLDVLGIGFTPAGQLHTTFADCRSTEGRALERMFWVRGVADFVDANDAFLVRAHDVPPAARTLASRLAIGVLTPGDFAAMEATFPTGLNLTDGPLGCLFNRDTAAAHLDAHNDADRKLRRLLDYLEFDYWIYDQRRNMTQLVAHLSELLRGIDDDRGSARRSDWAERDRAIVLTAVLAGLRADELVRADIRDIRPTDEGGVVHVHGKGNKDRRIPVEQPLIRELEAYLDSRAARFPGSTKRRPTNGGLAAWPPTAPLFVGSDGQRITRGAMQYRVLRAFKKAGVDSQRARGVLVHGFRHTFATELANGNVSVYALMKLLGHESMATSQRYVDGAGTQNRAAAAQNPLYGLIKQPREP